MNQHAQSLTTPRLCPDLQGLLDAELAAGNMIADVGPGLRGPNTWLVLLKFEFKARPADLPEGVTYREINDPHWWKAEYFHTGSRNCIACGFSTPVFAPKGAA